MTIKQKKSTNKGINFFLFILILLIFHSLILKAQKYNDNFVNFTLENGLSNNTINCVFQDKKGFIWIGTNNGLNKFDGYIFTNYHSNPPDSTSLSNDIIVCITEDASETLWIATKGGGINKFDRNTGKFFSYKNNKSDPNSISENTITSLCCDETGNIWIGTQNSGLNKYDINKKKFENYRHNPADISSICSDTINTITYIGNSRLLIGTPGGLNYFDFKNNITKSYKNSDEDNTSLYNNNVRVIFHDNLNQIWIGTSGNGLQKFDISTQTFITYEILNPNINLKSPFSINCITEDKENRLLIATTPGKGIIRLNKITSEEELINYYDFDINNYTERIINTIFIDRTNVLWAGTGNLGLDKIDMNKKKFNYYTAGLDFQRFGFDRKIWSVYNDEDDDNIIWLGTLDGLKLYNRKNSTTKTFRIDNYKSTGNINITSITKDTKGYLWLGTWGSGLKRFDIKHNSFTSFNNNLSNSNYNNPDYIRTVFRNKNGLLWIGTGGGGISTFNPETNEFQKFSLLLNDSNSLKINDISVIYEDRYNEMWIGTGTEGLIRYNTASGKFIKYRFDASNMESLVSDQILSICEDKKGEIWIGTLNGLEKFERSTGVFQHYLLKDGLPDETINAILADDNNNLWLATNNGLSKFNTEKKTFRNYNDYDGLQSKEFHHSCYKNKRGELFFCGVDGFNSFFPDSVIDIENKSNVAITSFKVLNNVVNLGTDISDARKINLSYNDNSFSFEFSLLDYSNPSVTEYAYKMDGYDKGWIYSRNIRTAKYSNLDPGEYTFWVKAANNDDMWSKPTSVRIFISSPFWKSRWLYVIFSFFLIIGIAGIFLNIKINRKRNKLLESNLKERNRELEKTSLILRNESLERQKIEQSLRYSEEEYHLLVEHANEAIVVFQDGKIIFSNARLFELIDYTSEEITLDYFINYIHPDDRELVITNYQKRLKNEDAPNQYSIKVIKKNSKQVIIEINSVHIKWKDKPAMLYFFSDITDRKKAEDEIKFALEKERELSELRSRFISMTSHEFRTPLTSIFTSSELLEKYGDKLSEEQKRKSLNRIQNNVQHMTSLLNEVLILGKSDSGMLKLKLEPVDVSELCSDIVEEFNSYTAFKTGHKLILEIEKFNGRVLLDYKLIKQSLENLISNAIKYSQDGTAVDFNVLFTNRFITFKIKDEGIGIPEDDINNLFEQFFRAKNTGNIPGTGLGLAIVKRAVELHDGKVRLTSKVGEGSEFIITIPLIKVV